MSYTLWEPNAVLPDIAQIPSAAGVRVEVIKEHNKKADGYGFTLGVVIARHKGKLYASWGANKGAENTQTEVVCGSVRENGAWSAPEEWLSSDVEAVSHGVFLSHQDVLWGFFPHFVGMREKLRTHIYRLDDNTGRFREVGLFPNVPFWPLTEPQLMENGSYLMAGCWVGGGWLTTHNPPAVAISDGGDLASWRVIKVPKPDDMVVWGECTPIINGADILLVSRCRRDNPVAMVAVSKDYGETWSVLEESNLPMCDAKPYAGVLSTGHAYLVACCSADGGAGRYPLTIALTRPGEKQLSKVFSIRTHNAATDKAMAEEELMALAYPYAIELDGALYVTYGRAICKRGTSSNDVNSPELAVVPVASLTEGW